MFTKTFGPLTVPAIGYGAGGRTAGEESHWINVIQAAMDLGMNLIDTAESYEKGWSEAVIGKAIQGKRDKAIISTKFNPEHATRQGITKSLEESLKRLGTSYVDIYQIHWPNPKIPVAETMQACAALQKQGKIRHIGVSNFALRDLQEAEKACPEPIRSAQVEYHLYERSAEKELLPYARTKQILIMAYSPLQHGHKGIELLNQLATRYHKSVSQIILNWHIAHDNIVPIPKTLNLQHLKENAEATAFRMEKKDLDQINQIFKPIIADVPTDKIQVLSTDKEPAYVTLEEALENRFHLVPSVPELAEEILAHQLLKPVRLRPARRTGRAEYELLQGRMRYWAWVYAYKHQKPIPAYIES